MLDFQVEYIIIVTSLCSITVSLLLVSPTLRLKKATFPGVVQHLSTAPLQHWLLSFVLRELAVS